MFFYAVKNKRWSAHWTHEACLTRDPPNTFYWLNSPLTVVLKHLPVTLWPAVPPRSGRSGGIRPAGSWESVFPSCSSHLHTSSLSRSVWNQSQCFDLMCTRRHKRSLLWGWAGLKTQEGVFPSEGSCSVFYPHASSHLFLPARCLFVGFNLILISHSVSRCTVTSVSSPDR